ncbi:UDP-N-acetylmuramate dehydrogenase [Sporichthya polymorpha]|uniref:UDP-N-acetylmuramate dehydrogenase n=1 Tax=Sporichthya polymorpha TaxID=35751 RepID=UPI00036F4278|nr:UDP-N-acetylmuramate dehydrogenase [Sporichthya polymorpha]
MTSFAELTTFRVGGPIARLVDVAGVDELAALFAEAGDEPVMVLGGGSNLLVTDDGFAGTVARMVGDGLAVSGGADDGSDDSVDVLVEAGANWDALVEYTVEQGWAGIEALSGIPGSVGATPIQNVGAYGQEVADVITAVRTFDRETGTERRFAPADCGFAYRDSLFKRTSRFVVTAVEFRLTAGGTGAPVRYAELARTLGVEVGGTAPVADVRAAVLGLRRSKGMVLDPDDHDTWSAGSFFTNPILTSAVAGAALPDDAPRYPAGDGLVKTSAAWLIEHAGFSKGFGAELTGGRATLSTKHTLALTNRGGASAADLLTLARAVRAGVLDRFGIELHHEPVLVGHTL